MAVDIPSEWIERAARALYDRRIGPAVRGARVGDPLPSAAARAALAAECEDDARAVVAAVLDGCEVREEYGLKLNDGTEWWSAWPFADREAVTIVGRKYKPGSTVICRTVLTHTSEAVPVDDHAAKRANGCEQCGTCVDHDACADKTNPLQPGDCADCGACSGCIAECVGAVPVEETRTDA